MGDDRPNRYLDPDGTVVYRASSLGMCDGVVLGLAAGRKPAKTPEWMLEVYEEGNVAEPLILAQLLAMEHHSHLSFEDDQHEVELEIGEINDRRIIVRGHTDGWVETSDAVTIVEAKKFRDSTWPKFQRSGVECMDIYPWQVSVYMHAALQEGLAPTLLFVGGHWDGDGGVSEIGVFQHLDPPIPFKDIRKRVARWENMIESGMDVTDLDSCSTRMFPCAMFGKGCPSETAEVEAHEWSGSDGEVAVELGKLLVKYAGIKQTANQMLAAAEKEYKNASEGLRGLIEATGVESARKFSIDGVTITRVVKETPAHERKASKSDYFQVSAPKKESTPQ